MTDAGQQVVVRLVVGGGGAREPVCSTRLASWCCPAYARIPA